jgi:hypothetical protein
VYNSWSVYTRELPFGGTRRMARGWLCRSERESGGRSSRFNRRPAGTDISRDSVRVL